MSHPGRNELHRSSARLAYAVALALAGAAPAHVLAQAAPPPPAVPAIPATPPENLPNTPEGEKETQELETIVVTGFRASLEVSLDMKRESAASVDTILAEDIAKFPDLNLAEAIQRIPGVAIARDAGEGRNISVRGLGPQFTRVRINGMEALSTAGGTDAAGGTNRSRAFDFNVFASELFNSITVTKTASAATEEGSLGATVDLLTGRPFDYNGNQFVTSFQAGYNDLSGEVDPRMALLASGQFADGTIGAMVSIAYAERNLYDDGREHGALAVGRLRAAGSHVQGHAHAAGDQRRISPPHPALRPLRERADTSRHHRLAAVPAVVGDARQPGRAVRRPERHP